jgi:WD40 repeat protein
MKKVVLVLVLIAALAAAENVGISTVSETRQDGSTVVHTVVFTGTEHITLNSQAEARPRVRTDTGELWVDRNHRAAIVQGISVQGDGMGIFADWYLNAQRMSYYRTLGTGVPAWEGAGEFNGGSDGHQQGLSQHGEALAASTINDAREWSKVSGIPRWHYGYPAPEFALARVSTDGAVMAAATTDHLYAFDSQTGDTLWTAPYNVSNGLEGLALSTDGSIVALTVYDSCHIFENGTLRGSIPIGVHNTGTQFAAKLSGDGKYVVTGDYQGHVRLYRWSGSNYDLKWSASVGNPWVTDVNISRDGSTIAAGTGYNSGKAVVFDSSSSTPLWSFQGFGAYGAEVASCAVSDNGSRIAFACWGDTIQSGSTYVLTVHDRSSATPLCGVQRDEEVGSLFACDISGDGQYVAAGGKAVHAYRMGNGGEVYTFLIGHTPGTNVGFASIESPGRFIQVGTPVTPAATVTNYGDSAVSFKVYASIAGQSGTVYQDSAAVSNLAPQASQPLTFTDWTPTAYDYYDFTFRSALPGDEYSGDDTLAIRAKCYHDAYPGAIPAPFPLTTVGYNVQPVVKAYNNGSYTDDILVGLTIYDSLMNPVYTASQTANSIPAGDSSSVSLTDWAATYAGPYTAVATATALTDDFIPGNDTLRKALQGTWEIIYDDGVADAYYWVGPSRPNSKFYVRFSPTARPPFTVTGGRIWVNQANQIFSTVAICKDDNGLPDTATVLGQVDSVSTPSAPGWITFTFDVPRIDTYDLWMVATWPDNSPGLGVGADATHPLDLRSYFSSNQDTFYHWTTHDWMMRLNVLPTSSGIQQGAAIAPLRFALGMVHPNPFRDAALVSYSLAAKSRVALRVFDATGRQVRTLVNADQTAGNYTLRWDGRDEHGQLVPEGIYFCRMSVPEAGFTQSRKLMLTR